MKKIPEEFVLNLAFRTALDKEELLIKKYEDYATQLRTQELLDIVREFEKQSHEHINALKDMMIKLNIQG